MHQQQVSPETVDIYAVGSQIPITIDRHSRQSVNTEFRSISKLNSLVYNK